MTVLHVQLETLAQARDEIEALLPDQFARTGDPSLTVTPNWAIYMSLETRGVLVLMVIREEGKAVGYMAGVVHPHVNDTSVLCGTISTYYLEERSGKVFVFKAMLFEMMNAMRRKGVQRMFMDDSPRRPCGRLFELLGASVLKTTYEFRLDQTAEESTHA